MPVMRAAQIQVGQLRPGRLDGGLLDPPQVVGRQRGPGAATCRLTAICSSRPWSRNQHPSRIRPPSTGAFMDHSRWAGLRTLPNTLTMASAINEIADRCVYRLALGPLWAGVRRTRRGLWGP